MANITHDRLTVEEAAEALGLSPRAVRHRIKAGTLKAEKIGAGRTAPYLIPASEVARAAEGVAS